MSSWIFPHSSIIRSYKYEDENLILSVEYKNGDTYRYENVHPHEFTEVVNAESTGSSVRELMKDKKWQKNN